MAARAGASSDDAATTDQLAYVDSRHWETTLVCSEEVYKTGDRELELSHVQLSCFSLECISKL